MNTFNVVIAGKPFTIEQDDDGKFITPAALWEGYGTSLKPAVEPCMMVQKPLDGTFANNVVRHGCGALNIDGSRIGTELVSTHPNGSGCTGDNGIYGHFGNIKGSAEREGRFPANLILDEESAAALDLMTAGKLSPGHWAKTKTTGFGEFGGGASEYLGTGLKATDGKEGASRFFKTVQADAEPLRFMYTAKVSTKERNAGCEALEPRRFETSIPYGQGAEARAESNTAGSRNNHPTLKPIALTTYLANLLAVPSRPDGQPRRILVPFSGAGSEMIGCLLAGWDDVTGIELDPEYVRIAEARIAHHTEAEPKAA